MRWGYVDTRGGQVHRASAVCDEEPVAFFHQTASSGRMWYKVMGHLAGRWSMHAFDTPGFGSSFDPEPDSRPALSDYVDWMHDAISATVDGPVHIVGHHTGACIAVELAARHPEIARSLTLAGPVPLTPDERVAFSRTFGSPFTPTSSGAHLLDNWQYLRDLGAAEDLELFNREMADMLRAWRGRVQAYAAVWSQDFTSHLLAVRCPLLIMAAPDDVLYPYLERARQLRPDATTHPIGGANFEPDLDSANFASGLNSFLKTIKRR